MLLAWNHSYHTSLHRPTPIGRFAKP